MFSTQNTEQHSKKHKTQIKIKSPSTTKGSSYKVSLKQKSKRIDEGLNLSTSGQNTCVIPLSYSLNYILNLHKYLYLNRFGLVDVEGNFCTKQKISVLIFEHQNRLERKGHQTDRLHSVSVQFGIWDVRNKSN